MTQSLRPRALTPVLEDSLDAATGQARSWERALASPRFTIDQVAAGVEARLLANVGSMAQFDEGGADEVLVPALDGDDAHQAFAAALGLLEGVGDSVPKLIGRLESLKAAPPLLRALGLTGNPRVEKELRALVTRESDAARLAKVLEVLAFRGVGSGVDFRRLLGAGQPPEVTAAALRMARGATGAEVSVRTLAERLLHAKEPTVRDAAIEAGLLHGSKPAWAAAQEAVEAGEVGPEGSGVALFALAVSGESEDVARLAKLASLEAHRPEALFALGFTGSPLAIEVCLAAMGDKRSARVAGEAFSAITGLRIEGEYCQLEARRPTEPVPFEEEDLDADLVPGPESELPVPDAEKVLRWWGANTSRFSTEARYLGGVLLGPTSLLEGFRRGPTRRRHVLGLELAIRTRREWRVETRQWARAQLAKQGAQVKPVMLPFGVLFE